jgi:hypothetical protein
VTVPEKFLIRTVGGPHPGTRIAPADVMPWPLPDALPDERGRYVKRSESQLPPQADGSHVMRGAEYEWEADALAPPLTREQAKAAGYDEWCAHLPDLPCPASGNKRIYCATCVPLKDLKAVTSESPLKVQKVSKERVRLGADVLFADRRWVTDANGRLVERYGLPREGDEVVIRTVMP